MDHIELPFVKMSTNAVTPTRATEGSVGLDFYSPANYIIPSYSQLLIPTQIKLGIPLGHYGRLASKSGLANVVPPQSWGDRSDTKHSKCLLLGGRRLNQLTLIPKPKGSGGARAATAQVGPANNRNDTKRCLPVEASLRPGEAVPW